ncbi:hypothetical protein Droror1_Dr00001983 [Drosera rotundifolia]
MREPAGPYFDLVMEMALATAMSFGVVANSFYEIEPRFVDYWNENIGPRVGPINSSKSWCIGPLCWAETGEDVRESRAGYFDWLDQKRLYGKEVLYIAFGTQTELTDEQLRVIALGLERSEVEFLWAKGILNHESVTGFLSHRGWNSVLESVCAGVPILGWPMMAEQHLNAKMVVGRVSMLWLTRKAAQDKLKQAARTTEHRKLGTDLSSARLQLDTDLSLAGLQLGGVVFREERSELGGTDFVEGRSEDVGDAERGCSLMRRRGPMMGEVNITASGGRSRAKEATPWWIRREEVDVIANLV